MADLGNLQFSILYKDDPKQLDRIKEQAMKKLKGMNLITNISGSIDKKELLDSVRTALKSERFKIDVVVDKASAIEAARAAIQKAGLDTNYTSSDLRAARARAVAAKSEAYVNAQRELARQRAAAATKAELGLAAARERSANAANNHARASLNLGNGLNANVRIAGELKNQMLGIYSIYTIERFISSLVRVRGEFDMQLISLKAILQSGEKASELFNQIKSLSVISPFQFKDLIGYAKQLSAYQIPNSELFDTTKRLADLSAGLGVDMNRIILAYGQVRSAAFLRGQELRQFTEAGIPMVQALADKFSQLENRVVSTGEVFDKISKRQVPFEMVKEVMEDLTDEGGRFYMMQEKQSESLQGKISNLRDAYDIMLNSIGEAHDGILKGSVDALTSLMENSDKLISIISSLAVTYGAYRTMVILNSIALGKETQSVVSETLANKAKRADMLTMASMYRTLTKEEQIAISTRKQMTMADWRAVASSGALSKEHALRLVRLGKLTELQAMELTSIYAATDAERALYQSQVKKALSMRTNIQLGKRMTQVLGTFGVTSKGLTKTVNSLKLGLWGMANGIGNAFASLVSPANIAMLAIGALIYTIINYKKEQQELSNRIKQTGDAIKDSYDELNKFLTDNPLNIAFNNGDEGIKAFIDKLKEQVKENSPIAIEILAKANGIEDNVEKLNFLRKALEDTAQAYLVASDAKDIFENANVATDDWGIDDKLDKNLNDYADALREFNYELSSTKRADLLSKLPVFGENANEIRKNIEAMRDAGKSLPEIYDYYYNAFAKNAKWNDGFITHSMGKINGLKEILEDTKKEVEHDFDTFYKDLETQIENKGIDVNSIFGKTFVERLKKEFFTNNNIQEQGQKLFNLMLDRKFINKKYLEYSNEIVGEIGRLMKLGGKDAVREFSNTGEWSDGMRKALDAAIKEVKTKMPEFKDIIDKTINNQEFEIKIKALFQTPNETEIQKWAKSVYSTWHGSVKGFENSGLKPGNDANSVVDFIDDLKKQADDYNDKIDALTKVYNSKKNETVKKELDEYITQRDAIINQLAASGYNYIRKGKNEEDPVLELLKERFKQIQDFKSMYEKYIDTYGKLEALNKTKKSGLFAADLFKDSTPENIRENINKELDKIIKASGNSTKDRRALSESGFKFKGEIIFEEDKEQLQHVLSEIDKYISQESKKWDLFKSIYDNTGDKEVAMKFAFGGIVSFENEAAQWKAEIEKALLENGKNDIDITRILGLSPKNVEKEIGGTLGKTLSKYVKEYQDSNSKIQSDTVKNVANLIAKYKDYNQQIIDIEEKANKDIRDLEAQRLTPGGKSVDIDRIIAERNKRRNEDKASVGFKQLKDSEEWSKVFDDLDRVGTVTLNHLIDMLEAYKQSAGKNLKVTDYKELINALKKLREESSERNPFKDFGKHVKEYIEAWKEAAEAKKRYKAVLDADIEINNGKTTVREALANAQNETTRKGIENAEVTIDVVDAEGKATKVTTTYAKALNGLAEAEDGVREEADPLKKSFAEIAKYCDAAAQGCGDLSGMFDSLGNGGASDVLDMLGGIASGIGDLAAGIASGDPLAMVTGGISAITGIISAIAQFHDKKLDRAIEKSKLRAQQLQNVYEQIDRLLEKTLGSGANVKLVDAENDKVRLNQLNGQIDAIRNKGKIDIFDLISLSKYAAEADKLQKRVKAYNEGGAYGYQRALMQEQMSELEKQRQAEIDKKKTDDSKVEDYNNQIAELKQEIKDFAEDAADSLYGINLKDWASQLGDALYEAWQKGEDGAEAFKKKAAEIMGDVMNSVLKLTILEPAMKDLQTMLFGEDGQSGMFGNDFSLDDSELESLADYLMGISSKTDDYYDAMDKLNEYMEKKYGVSMKEEAESSGLSRDIEGVTENTANLLASYLNSVRADVSMKLQLVRQIVDEHFPRMNLLAEAQLTELKAISRNTANNVELVTEIRDMLNAARLSKDRGFHVL